MAEAPTVLLNLPVKVTRKEYERFVANLAGQSYGPVMQDGGVYVDHVCVAPEGGDDRFVYPAAFARFGPMAPNRHAPVEAKAGDDVSVRRRRVRERLAQAFDRIPGLGHKGVGALVDDLETFVLTTGAGSGK